jgi:hypothetical protein
MTIGRLWHLFRFLMSDYFQSQSSALSIILSLVRQKQRFWIYRILSVGWRILSSALLDRKKAKPLTTVLHLRKHRRYVTRLYGLTNENLWKCISTVCLWEPVYLNLYRYQDTGLIIKEWHFNSWLEQGISLFFTFSKWALISEYCMKLTIHLHVGPSLVNIMKLPPTMSS